MTFGESAKLLQQVGWGVIAVAEGSGDAARPIGVPVSYAPANGRLYLAMTDGRKLRALIRNPQCCLTVTDVRSLDVWRSVAVVGRVRRVVESSERAMADAAFREQARRSGWDLATDDYARLAHSQMLMLVVEELHGYARGDATRPDDHRADSEREAAGDRPATVAMDALRRVVRSLHDAEAESEAALGVTTAQLFVLREIDKADTLTVGELATRTATAQSSVSEVLARLLARGLITRTRSSVDRRRAEISLSATGHALLARAPESIQERLLAAFARLSADRRRHIADGLAAWVDEAGLGQLAATMFFEPVPER
jgi:DNA-binding MarR family transcriptional regulator/nitroimidazol reductase NimA-like FMN-containing flavoprotein (pyridoxamine 5'-phosphate oxidase superfamily)